MNKLVKDLKDSFIASLMKTTDALNISYIDGNKAIHPLHDKLDAAFNALDEVCTEFGKNLLKFPSKKEKDPEGLTLIFSGKNGGKIYCTPDSSNPLIINDEFLITRDIKALNNSFYQEDYIQASKLTKLMKEKGVITLKEYQK